MKKANTLKKNKDFSYCYRRGKKYRSDIIGMYVAASKYNVRAGFCVSKKVGNAVTRNLIRRRLKECLTPYICEINKNCSIVIVANDTVVNASYQKICSEVERLLKIARVL